MPSFSSQLVMVSAALEEKITLSVAGYATGSCKMSVSYTHLDVYKRQVYGSVQNILASLAHRFYQSCGGSISDLVGL